MTDDELDALALRTLTVVDRSQTVREMMAGIAAILERAAVDSALDRQRQPDAERDRAQRLRRDAVARQPQEP